MIVYGHADKRCCCRTDWGPTVLLMNGRAANARNPHVARNTTFPLAPGAVIAPCWIDNRVIQCSLGCAAQMVKWMDTNFLCQWSVARKCHQSRVPNLHGR